MGSRMRMMSLHGISHDAWKRYTKEGSWYYEVIHPGFKYNLTDIAAAIGIEQLKKCDAFGAARNRIATAYNKAFSDLPEIQRLYAKPDIGHAWHLFRDSVGSGAVEDHPRSVHRSFKGIRDRHLGALHSLASASLLSRQVRPCPERFSKGNVRCINGFSPCRSIPR